ncbi:hypothetical protein VR010_05865 [Actinomycetaceae bacterium L2_0104]
MTGRRLATLRLLVTSSLVVLTAGCTSSDEADSSGSGSASPNALNLGAEVDYEKAIVTLPADQVAFGEQVDASTLSSAHMAAVAQCARDELGIPWTAEMPDPYIPAEHMWVRYGPWTKPVAEKFAFIRPMGDGALIVNGYVPKPEGHEWDLGPNVDISDDQREKVFATCNGRPEAMRFDEGALWVWGPGQQALEDEYNAVNDDPRMRELLGDLQTCYEGKGMEIDPEAPGYIVPRVQKIDEEQISLALKTVECKDELDFTRRVADITAERQIPIIEEYADELFADRKKWDDTVAEAEEYIAAHPELFEPPK